MRFIDERCELPWAFAKRRGFTGKAPGLFFYYFKTKQEAEKSVRWMKRKKLWHGPIEYRPGEAFRLGSFKF